MQNRSKLTTENYGDLSRTTEWVTFESGFANIILGQCRPCPWARFHGTRGTGAVPVLLAIFPDTSRHGYGTGLSRRRRLVRRPPKWVLNACINNGIITLAVICTLFFPFNSLKPQPLASLDASARAKLSSNPPYYCTISTVTGLQEPGFRPKNVGKFRKIARKGN
ncbi:hypothetical protein B0H14DRAFT_2576914 [Mycena olivaceomarginata]|nr:hypothetical protein B0H14DRAFT_2576914 [Mycena olivaceomarginata]